MSALQQRNETRWTKDAADDCLGRLRRYLPCGEEISNVGQAWREVFQELPDAYLDDRENVVEEGEEAYTEVKALDTGFMNIGHKENDGGKEHWEQMADSYVPFTQLGFVFDIPEQTGGAMPDGLAKLDDALYLDDLDVDDHDRVANRINNYRDEHAILDRLAGTRDAFIESEHSTGQTQPSQTISNLAQAHNKGHRCLFICRPGEAEAIYDTVAGEEPCVRDSHSVEGEKRFYTFTPDTFKIDGQEITRPGTSDNVWVYDEQTGQYILHDNGGTEHARFDTAADIFTDASAYPSGGDRGVKPPAIPEYEFDGGDASAAKWDIITVPHPERDENDEKIPLSPADLELYQESESNVPLSDIIIAPDDAENDEKSREQTASPDTNTGTTASTSDGGEQSEARAADGGGGGDQDNDRETDADSDVDSTNSDPANSLPRMG